MKYKGIPFNRIGVMRSWNEDPNETGVGIYGNISTTGYSASAINDWIDLADAVGEAYGAPSEFIYVIKEVDGPWHIMDEVAEVSEG